MSAKADREVYMINEKNLEQRICTAVEHASPDKLDDILSSCQEQKGDMPMKKRKPNMLFRVCAAAAAAVLLFSSGYFVSGYQTTNKVDSIIMLDVNPSFSMSVNSKEKVLAVEAENEDAKTVLGTMDLAGSSLEVAVNALVGSMLQHGYLDELQNSILVSVENKDAARGEQLQKKVAAAITNIMQGGTLEGAVLSQTVSPSDTALVSLADQYQISLGKAALIQEAVAQDPTLSFDDMADLSIHEIALITGSRKLTEDAVTRTGTASTEAYISQQEAITIACTHAGVPADGISLTEISFDSEKGVIVYEVEFLYGGVEYDYDIDARTGEVRKAETENKSGGNTNAGNSSGGNTSTDNSSGGNTGAGNSSGGNDGNNSTGGSTQGNPSAGSGNLIGEDSATSAALKHAGLSKDEVDNLYTHLDYDDGLPEHYEVEFRKGTVEYEYEIDIYTGAVLKAESENKASGHNRHDSTAGSSGPEAAGTQDSYIGEEAAASAALKHAGLSKDNVEYLRTKIDYDDGIPEHYDVEFINGGTEYEYEINLYTGEILDFKTELHGSDDD